MRIEQVLYEAGAVVVLGKVGQQQVAHERRPVPAEQFQSLPVGKVAFAAADPVFEVNGVTALVQHLFIII